jgi:hypothetical protein
MLTAYRASHGLGRVRLDAALTAMAQRQADAMVAANALSHDAAGSFSSRIAAAGLDTTRAGENVGGGYYSLESAMTGWRDSAEHNSNILMPQATRFGRAQFQYSDAAGDALRHRHRQGRSHPFPGLLGDGSGGRARAGHAGLRRQVTMRRRGDRPREAVHGAH